MVIKQIYRVMICSSILILSAPLVANNPFEQENVWDIFDDPSIEDDLAMAGFLDTVSFSPLSRAIPIADILGLLESIGISSLLDTDFYLRTNPFAVRSLLDLPIFEIHQCNNPNDWVVGTHLFWNHTDRSVFTSDNTNISSYINLNQETLFQKLKELTPIIEAQFPDAGKVEDLLGLVDFNEVLDLFGCFTVQQRRVGLMCHAWRQWDRAEIRFLAPFYYLERNVFTNPENQAKLEEKFGTLDEESQEKFEKNHAVADKVGLGDTRFEADYAVYKTEAVGIRFGLMATLPTNVTVAEGLIGTSFRNYAQPTFDLEALFNLIPIDNIANIPEEDLQKARDIIIGDLCRNKNGFGLGILDRMNTLLLETPLGNYRHVGLGPLFRAHALLSSILDEYEWAEKISFNNRISLEFFTPANEPRAFIKRNTAAEFTARNFSNTDPVVQAENLAFLETELVDKFYPYILTTNVQPGLIFHMLNRWCFCGERWDFNMGSDFWLQTQESFNKICAPQSLIEKLDIENGKTPFAYQYKVYGGLGFKIVQKEYSLLFGINAEDTIWHKGIGKDWTVSLNVEANF